MALAPAAGIFVVDAEYVHALFTEHPAYCSTFLAAVSQGRVCITSLTMKQLKENCPEAHARLREANLDSAREQDLGELASLLIDNANHHGVDIGSPALMPKIYVLALAIKKQCVVWSRDCGPSKLSLKSLSLLANVQLQCV
jgi:hypothetical protein